MSARGFTAFFLLAASAAAGGCGLSPAGRPTPTFGKDVAPIVFTHCAPCHRPGQPVPFTLLRYEDVAARAHRIVRLWDGKIESDRKTRS